MKIVLSDHSGVIDRHPNFPSNYVLPRHVDVWLPASYSSKGTQGFPVLYMHDGQNLFDPAYAYGGVDWGIDEAISALSAHGTIPEMIVVGIWNTNLRWCEYMPQEPWAALGGERMHQNLAERCDSAVCISDNYLQFLVNELKPFIDHTYQTLPDFEHTSIMGSSMGGLISLYALCKYPQVFSKAGCVSTHWPAGEDYLVDYFGHQLPRPGRHKLYFDYGDQTLDALYEPFQLRMNGWLEKNGFQRNHDCLVRKFIGGEHSESSWRARLEIPLDFLFGH